MNYLWAAMMLLAVVYGALRGTVPAVTQAALDSAREAITLCLTMLGMLSFWMGMMQIGRASQIISAYSRGPSGTGTDRGKLYRQYAGTGMGGDAGRIKSHGRIKIPGRRPEKRPVFRKGFPSGDGQR